MSRTHRWLTLVTSLLVALAVSAPAASAKTRILGLGGWQVLSSANISQGGGQVSSPSFDTGGWLHVRPDDAGAVGTEVNALVQTGHCPNVFYDANLKSCFGYMDRIGPDTIPMFSVPWWFRTTFAATPRAGAD